MLKVPEALHSCMSCMVAQRQDRRLHYLDGLRRWASLFVVIFHSTVELFGARFPLLDAPALGPVNDGSLAVVVFFVLSGLALSQPFLHAGDPWRVLRMALGRHARLAIPVTAASFIALVMLAQGWVFNQQAAALTLGPWLDGFLHVVPGWGSWLKFSLFDVFLRYDGAVSYGPYLWTMQIEFMGSFLVFALLGLLGGSPVSRVAGYVMAAALLWHPRPFLVAFVAGALISEIVVSGRYAQLTRHCPRTLGMAGLVLLLAAWIGSAALRTLYTPLLACGVALALVLGVVLNKTAQTLLQAPLSRWLGRISFPLYLVHGLVICGPTSWGILELHKLGMSGTFMVGLLVPTTIIMSLIAAWLFLPIEALAVRTSHWVGEAGVRLVTVRKPGRAYSL